MMLMYNEIRKLHKMLDDAGIPHSYQYLWDGYQIQYPKGGDFRRLSAVQHEFAYGSRTEHIEIMGLLTNNNAVGYLHADEVFYVIEKDWDSYKESEDK